MSMQDPISDMLTRIRNGQQAGKVRVTMPASRQKEAIARVLTRQGYVRDFSVEVIHGESQLAIVLRYFEGRPVIETIQRVSRPGLQGLQGKERTAKGHGRARHCHYFDIQGIDDDHEARIAGHGGEVVCVVA